MVDAPVQPYSGDAVVQEALRYVGGVSYSTGDTPEDGFECDGFVKRVLGRFGITMPRGVSGDRRKSGAPVIAEHLYRSLQVQG